MCDLKLFSTNSSDRNYGADNSGLGLVRIKSLSVMQVGMYDRGNHSNFASHPGE